MKLLIPLLLVLLSTLSSARAEMPRQILRGNVPFEWIEVDNSPITFKKVKLALFDADSTLRVSRSGKPSANAIQDVAILPCVAPRMAQLQELGYVVAIVSNQGGIQAGIVSDSVAQGALQFTIREIEKRNPKASIHYFDYAGYRNLFRKSDTGMALLLEQRLRNYLFEDGAFYGGVLIDKEHSFMVGDSLFKKNKDKKPNGKPGVQFSNSDRCFAENYGVRYLDPADFFGWKDLPEPIALFDSYAQLDPLPDEVRAGGIQEAQFCQSLERYAEWTETMASMVPTSQWVADYEKDSSGQKIVEELPQKVGCSK